MMSEPITPWEDGPFADERTRPYEAHELLAMLKAVEGDARDLRLYATIYATLAAMNIQQGMLMEHIVTLSARVGALETAEVRR